MDRDLLPFNRTRLYAVPRYSDLDRQIRSGKIGVVWHTTYSGQTLEKMSASFGANISGLRKNKAVWMDDATYRDETELRHLLNRKLML